MQAGLEGRHVLITGASGGIGSAVSEALAAEGAQPLLHYLSQGEKAQQEAARLTERHGVEADALCADLRDEASVDALFSQAIALRGRVDAVVVNAGVWPADSTPLHRMSFARWRDTQAVNLDGAFLCCRRFLDHLAQQRREHAAIVMVGSTAGIYGEEGHADYAASKSALEGLTLTLKNEIVRLAPLGRVNLVCPGWVATPMARQALEDRARVDRVTSTMALRKVATPEDVARAIVFLLSDRLSGHLTGTVLPIAGGMEGRRLH